MHRRDLAVLTGLLALGGCSTFTSLEKDVASISLSNAALTEIFGIVKGVAEVALEVATGDIVGAISTGITTVETAISGSDQNTALASLLQLLTDAAPYITAVANKT